MGYNKNIASYITKALAAEKANPGMQTKLITLNAYKRHELEECFTVGAYVLCGSVREGRWRRCVGRAGVGAAFTVGTYVLCGGVWEGR